MTTTNWPRNWRFRSARLTPPSIKIGGRSICSPCIAFHKLCLILWPSVVVFAPLRNPIPLCFLVWRSLHSDESSQGAAAMNSRAAGRAISNPSVQRFCTSGGSTTTRTLKEVLLRLGRNRWSTPTQTSASLSSWMDRTPQWASSSLNLNIDLPHSRSKDTQRRIERQGLVHSCQHA